MDKNGLDKSSSEACTAVLQLMKNKVKSHIKCLNRTNFAQSEDKVLREFGTMQVCQIL